MLHAVLSDEDVDATDTSKVKSIHMGPPFGRIRQLAFAAVGSCELSTKHVARITEFVDQQFSARKAERLRLAKLGLPQNPMAQYRIQPPYSRPRKGCSQIRYSCVGFVLLAYKSARIELVSSACPLRTVEDLKSLYPPIFHAALDDETQRIGMGLDRGNRWPVMLVGYVLHALNRTSDQIIGKNATQYQPQEGDEFFPRQPSEEE